jgi:hypothetical protein
VAQRAARREEKLEEERKRRELASFRKAERAAAKEARERAANSRKRPLVEDQVEAGQKRPCLRPPSRRSKQDISNSPTESVIRVIELDDGATSAVVSG